MPQKLGCTARAGLTRADLRRIIEASRSLRVTDGFCLQPYYDIHGPFIGTLRVALPLDGAADHSIFLEQIYARIGNYCAASGIVGHG